MSDCNNRNGNDSFREAVCIDTQRIYDSCSDKDCVSDLAVTLDEWVTIPEGTTVLRSRCAEISDVCINVECVPFNKGFYSVDITYTFRVYIDAYTEPCGTPTSLTGTTIYTKKVVLYGSEGAAKVFTSENNTTPTTPSACPCLCSSTLPLATVQAVDPLVLDAKLVKRKEHCCPCDKDEKEDAVICKPKYKIYVTLGLFSIVQLSRPVSMLIPVYDFCIPCKDCTTNSESPCEIFDKIDFPSDEFFPPAIDDNDRCK